MTSIILAVFSFIAFVVLIPPFTWQCYKGNTAQAMLLFWLAITDLITFIGVVIWGPRDFRNRWDGKVYCDFVSRLDAMTNMGKVLAVCAIMFTLNEILKLKNPSYIDPRSLKKRLVTWVICLLMPLYGFIMTFFLQSPRYNIVRHYGCRSSYSLTTTTVVLLYVPMGLILIPTIAFAILTVKNCLRKKKELANILKCTNSNMLISRFARVLVFSLIVILVLTPLTIYIIATNSLITNGLVPLLFVYNSVTFNQIRKFDIGERPLLSRIINTALLYVAILILGTGKSNVAMYKTIWRFIARRPQQEPEKLDQAGTVTCVDTNLTRTDSVYNAKNLNFGLEITRCS
ncbi:hypothetical protein JNB11_03930 [Kocuria palustris]|nr:hypothetical protein [Kocuria palustris]